MKANKQFEKHYPRIRLEAMLKSFFWGISAGFAASFTAALITWFTAYNGLITALIAFFGVSVIVSVLLYFLKFRASVIASARRLDSMGLDERVITMIELQNDDSIIASIQREDAKKALNAADEKQIRFRFTKRLTAILTTFAILACAMTTVATLAYKGLLPKGSQLLDEALPDEMEEWVSITYLVEEGGTIEGEDEQLVIVGKNAEPVLAVADDGYVFIGWDDGVFSPSRTDRNVEKDIVVMAIFEPIEDEEGEDDDGGDGESGEDQAGEPEKNQGDNDNQQDPENQTPESEDSDAPQGGGKYEDHNQIIDGKTYYREKLESYKAEIEQFLKEYGDTLTEEEKAIILSYIGIV